MQADETGIEVVRSPIFFFNSMRYFREAQKQEILVSTYICIVLTCNQSETFELSLLYLRLVNVTISQLVFSGKISS